METSGAVEGDAASADGVAGAGVLENGARREPRARCAEDRESERTVAVGKKEGESAFNGVRFFPAMADAPPGGGGSTLGETGRGDVKAWLWEKESSG